MALAVVHGNGQVHGQFDGSWVEVVVLWFGVSGWNTVRGTAKMQRGIGEVSLRVRR
jgi:hypothetical protein